MPQRGASEADGADDQQPTVLIRPSAASGAPRRNGYIPVTDLLAREGKLAQTDDEDDYSVADSVASVRKGMSKVTIGVLAIVGAASLAKGMMVDSDGGDVAGTAIPMPVVAPGTAHPEPEVVKALSAASEQKTEAKKTTKKKQVTSSERSSGGSAQRQGSSPASATQTRAPAPAPQQTAVPAPAPKQTQTQQTQTQPKQTQQAPASHTQTQPQQTQETSDSDNWQNHEQYHEQYWDSDSYSHYWGG